MRALLDVNVLIALLDRHHQMHATARSWLQHNIQHGWASCPVTQNGFIRILSQPAYPNTVSPTAAITLLREATATKYHEFWPDTVSLLNHELVDSERIHGTKQVTDIYLLALATKNGGRFVTFDDRIPRSPVPNAGSDNLEII